MVIHKFVATPGLRTTELENNSFTHSATEDIRTIVYEQAQP